ncbi:MAG: DUF2256 and DUF3253 domain-containing protein [Pseudomonadota bacterium]
MGANSHRRGVKTCQACGRPMTYRKKWAASWDEVKYCSKACRSAGVPDVLMATILALLDKRDGKTICPSEVLNTADKQDPKKMERVRGAARLLAHEGKLQITQRGQIVDPNTFKGPIRLRRA